MAGITHAFVSAVEDSADETLIRPSNWNAEHVIAQAITDNAPLTVDDASAADGEYARFTANGIEGVAVTGATLPNANTMVGYFIHSPTGRSILYFSNGTTWTPIISIGSMTVYVDKTDGTDDANHGTAVDADAFKTVQYAVNMIPGSFGGNVNIYVNGETYNETVTIQGKNPTGNYSINLYGTLTSHETHAQTASVQGATTTFGSISDTTNDPFAGHANDLLYSSNNAEYRVIDSVTTEVATICQYWTAAPSGNYIIYQWSTTITALVIKSGQVAVNAYDCYFYGAGVALTTEAGSIGNFYRCKFATSAAWAAISLVKSYNRFDDCFITGGAGYCVLCLGDGAVGYMNRGKVLDSGGTSIAVLVTSTSYFKAGRAFVIDGTTSTSNKGISLISGAVGTGESYYSKIRNFNVGISATQGGTFIYTANHQYSTNDTNESADATSFSYID